MRNGVIPIVAAMLACFPFGPAQSRPINMVGSEAQEALKAFVRCNLITQRAITVDYALNVGTANAGAGYQKLGSQQCRRQAEASYMRISSGSFSGAVAEELLSGRDLTSLDAAIPSAPAIDHGRELTQGDYQAKGRLTRAQFEGQLPEMNGQRMLSIVVDCAVRRSPALARAVFTSEFASDAERSAISNLLPAVSACLGSGQVKVLPMQLRGALARNYLRLAVVAVPSFRETLS